MESHVRPAKKDRMTPLCGCLRRTCRRKDRRRSSFVLCIVYSEMVVMTVIHVRMAAELPSGFSCWKSAAKKTVDRCGSSLKPLCKRTATSSSICDASSMMKRS
eukprot:6859782-Pyramimonas_sp.AAC.1